MAKSLRPMGQLVSQLSSNLDIWSAVMAWGTPVIRQFATDGTAPTKPTGVSPAISK